MNRRQFLYAGAATALMAAVPFRSHAVEGPIVHTQMGYLRGLVLDGVHVFRGVPCGMPPYKGRYRLALPEPAEPWTGIIDAATFGDIPLQLGRGTAKPVGGGDCLRLNIWTPAPGRSKCPVMVYIPGGGSTTCDNNDERFDGTAFAMCRHRNASPHVADNQVKVLIVYSRFLSMAPCHGPLVECMPDGHTGHQRRTGYARHILQFVHDSWISNVGTATGNALCQLVSYHAPQVAGMAADGFISVAAHLLVHFINSARNRTRKPSTPDNGIKMHRDVHLLQFTHHKITPELKLVRNLVETGQFLAAVPDVAQQQRTLVFINGNLGRCGTGINN